jgi:hypothetical protein
VYPCRHQAPPPPRGRPPSPVTRFIPACATPRGSLRPRALQSDRARGAQLLLDQRCVTRSLTSEGARRAGGSGKGRQANRCFPAWLAPPAAPAPGGARETGCDTGSDAAAGGLDTVMPRKPRIFPARPPGGQPEPRELRRLHGWRARVCSTGRGAGDWAACGPTAGGRIQKKLAHAARSGPPPRRTRPPPALPCRAPAQCIVRGHTPPSTARQPSRRHTPVAAVLGAHIGARE